MPRAGSVKVNSLARIEFSRAAAKQWGLAKPGVSVSSCPSPTVTKKCSEPRRHYVGSFSVDAGNVSWQRESICDGTTRKRSPGNNACRRREVLSACQRVGGRSRMGATPLRLSTIARLVGYLLQGEERWSRYYWVDAIRASRVRVRNDGELKLEGSLIWAEHKQRGMWIERLSATVRLSMTSKELVGYQIMIGDVARGLKKEPYSISPGRANRPAVAQWLFTFSEGL